MKNFILFMCSIALTFTMLTAGVTSHAGFFDKTYKGEVYCNTLKGVDWQNCNWYSNNFAPIGLNMRQFLCINYSWYYKKWSGIANYGEGAGKPYTASARIKCYTIKA